MNSALSLQYLPLNLLLPAKEKICYGKCPLLLPRVKCPLQGLFIVTLHFAKSQGSCRHSILLCILLDKCANKVVMLSNLTGAIGNIIVLVVDNL